MRKSNNLRHIKGISFEQIIIKKKHNTTKIINMAEFTQAQIDELKALSADGFAHWQATGTED